MGNVVSGDREQSVQRLVGNVRDFGMGGAWGGSCCYFGIGAYIFIFQIVATSQADSRSFPVTVWKLLETGGRTPGKSTV